MDNISFKNSYNQPIAEQQVKKLESQENFTALDKEKLKQDTVLIAQKSAEQVKENWVFRVLRKTFGVKDPKKMLTSIGLTIATIVGGATLGNKTVKMMANSGIKVDDFLKDNSIYKAVAGFFSNAKEKTANFLRKSKTITDVMDTLKNKRMKTTASMAKGMGQGFKPQFAYTVQDTIQATLLKSQGETYETLKKTVGKKNAIEIIQAVITSKPDSANELLTAFRIKFPEDADKIIREIQNNNEGYFNGLRKIVGEGEFFETLKNNIISGNPEADVVKFCDDFTQSIAKKLLGENYTKAQLNELLQAIKDGDGSKYGVDFSCLKDITMNREGIIGGWWPVNIINNAISKIKGKPSKFCKGNLGDALLKYNISAGKLADTKVGALVQKSILIPTESITNFVCDNAGMNLFLAPMIVSLYNTVQDAPKEKKAATLADDFVGSIGTLAISTPLAFGTTYGLASLKNLEGKTFGSKILKTIGKFFGAGLKFENGQVLKDSGKFGIKGAFGGTLRFVLSMLVFSSIFSKPIRAGIHKIFGKPYDEAEEKQKQALEAQKNEIIPGFNITYAELEEKARKNPQVIQRLQTDPIFAQEMLQNPQKLLAALDGKEIQTKPKDKLLSPANQMLTMQKANTQTQNKTNVSVASNKQNNQTQQLTQDTATYIPSSAFTAKASTLSQEQAQEYANIMARADKVLKNAEKYI